MLFLELLAVLPVKVTGVIAMRIIKPSLLTFLLAFICYSFSPSIAGACSNTVQEGTPGKIASGSLRSGIGMTIPAKSSIDPGFLIPGNPNIDPGISVRMP